MNLMILNLSKHYRTLNEIGKHCKKNSRMNALDCREKPTKTPNGSPYICLTHLQKDTKQSTGNPILNLQVYILNVHT